MLASGTTDERRGSVTPSDRTDRYLVVSGDSHAGPSLEGTLRQYCPAEHRPAFDDFAQAMKQQRSRTPTSGPYTSHAQGAGLGGLVTLTTKYSQAGAKAREWAKACEGHEDPHARVRDMDASGISAEVIFAGGQNDEVLPWLGSGFNAGFVQTDGLLRAVGSHIWNAWLADFVSVAPERLLGVMQVPIWDVDAAIREITWGREHGLRAVNLPAPRSDFASYNEEVYEPFWSACASLDLPLLTHSAGGEPPLGAKGRGAPMVASSECHWLSRRALGQMIFGSVFERHPTLRLVFTEQRVVWVAETLEELDDIHRFARDGGVPDVPPRTPSEYWASNCFVCGSFLAPFEVALRNDVGLSTMLWGSDYPHIEGTWPRTRAAMRNTFAGVSPDDVRAIVEDNGARVYGVDLDALRPVADRIGPTPEELSSPLAPEEFPEYRGLAFREHGSHT